MNNQIKKNIITLFFGLAAIQPVFANISGLFVEPMITYEQGDAELNLPDPFSSSESSVDGLGLGARLGIHVYETMFIGLDARYSRPTYENNDTGVDQTASSYNIGPIIGAQMPTLFGVRVWAGYIAGGEMDVETDDDVDFNFKSGNGYRIGGGVKVSIVSLNLEYQDIRYDETQLNDAAIFTGTTDGVDQTNQSLVLSVSFPITL